MLLPTGTIAVGAREEWSDAGGLTVVERLAPRVALARSEGYYSDELEYFMRSRVAAMLDELLPSTREPALQVFCDWAGMTSYSAGARTRSTSFVMQRRKQLALVCILVHSPVVATGVSVANMLLGGFLAATMSREQFDEQLARTVEAACER
ncbi:MAG: hypothetical protein A2138_11850 [Deltaproteobacteria bacterium RBG_16_71_12]|nr:MAG: hypothetical protein A2138_11850 [Deltaproteobacteria bacterium RBG_16_71_12]